MMIYHEKEKQKANDFITKLRKETQKSQYRLNYHFMAPTGWINDPNGLVFYKGEYHIFYQHDPYSPEWGPMHWGHAKSRDLINWDHLPIALAPSEEYDNGTVNDHGCFSGSAIVKNDHLYLFYTGHSIEKDPMQVQCMATSQDGINFKKHDGNPIITDFPKDGTKDFRDPKVWQYEEFFYMIVGSKKDGIGKALLYQSKDLYEWKYIGVVAESDGTQGDMWECPDLFSLDNKDVLIVSPMYGTKNEKPFYTIGHMSYKTKQFTQGQEYTLDYGSDFYAPQTFVDDKNRRIMIAWMDMWFTHKPSQKEGWAGAMTFPRELKVIDNKLYQLPVKEIESLRENLKEFQSFQYENEYMIDSQQSVSSEIQIVYDIAQSTSNEFGLFVRSSEDGHELTKIIIDIMKQEVIVDRNLSGTGEKSVSRAPISLINGKLELRILLDTTSVELFINGGEQVITKRIFPNLNSNLCKLFASAGKIKIEDLKVWSIKKVID
ncbi:glycoside hydrolase family 32 protein [Bacillus solitudinis]|uniref:glycoside hydrolase family 32 protein n=1 Tax=Bacillus solitudinis TaxID=2014074 RepID=UPI000C24436E|nr:glycoside hydrolase family 32 protein [Bacillus solitudinis]